MCASHTKRVGEYKIFYNSRSLQKRCSLVYPFKIILKLSCLMNYDGPVLHATTIILDSGDLSWSCRKKTVVPKKRVVPKKKIRARENWRREKETWWEKLGGTNLASPADILRRASRVPSIPFGSCMLCNLWHLSSFVIRACRQLPSKYGAFLVAFSLHRTLLEFIRYSYRD